MDIERIWALFRANCNNTKIWFDNHPVFILIAAAVFLWIAIFNMTKEKTSAGMWGIVVISSFLILYAFGRMSGLGFGMSF